MDKKWWTLIAVCAGMFMLLLDVTIVIVAQPSIQTGLHASFSDVQWTLDAYALTLAALLLTSGSLADRYGRKLLFSIGLTIFTLGSLLCGVAVNPLMLILSRSGQGVGGAMMFATSLALLGQSFRGRELTDDEKVPVLRAYLTRWKAEVGIFFEDTGPDSSDDQIRAIASRHPAFEVLTDDLPG